MQMSLFISDPQVYIMNTFEFMELILLCSLKAQINFNC